MPQMKKLGLARLAPFQSYKIVSYRAGTWVPLWPVAQASLPHKLPIKAGTKAKLAWTQRRHQAQKSQRPELLTPKVRTTSTGFIENNEI